MRIKEDATGLCAEIDALLDGRELSYYIRTGQRWHIGSHVRKIKGASWRGYVVGYYSTILTPEGYCVESERERGSVQLYPRAALERIPEL
jgi:hypothetical protein